MHARLLLLLTVLFHLMPVHDAAPENPDECDIDGGVRFINIGAYFGHIQGDVVGIILVCEAGLWKYIVLCEEEWTRENTVVACRQLEYTAGYFGVDNITVVEERRRLSYRPQCTGMEERLVNCTPNDTQCEGDGGRRVVISCWNISRDSSQPTLPVTTHTLAVQTSTITSIATVPSSVLPCSVLTNVVAIETGSVSKVPSFTPYIPTNPATEATSDTGGQLVVVSLAGVVTMGALVLVVMVVVCAVWKKRKGHRRSDDEGESREMEMNPAYQTTASLTSSITNPAYQTTASLIPSTTNPAYQTTASLTSATAYQTTSTASLTSHSPHLYEDVFHCQ